MIPSLCIGGAERHVVKLCRAIDPAEAELSVLLLRRGLAQPLRADLPPGIDVQTTPWSHRDPRVVAWLAQALRTRGASVAHSLLWLADAMTALAALALPRLAFVPTERGDRSFPYHTAARRMFDRLVTFPRAQAIAPNSEFGRRLLVRLGAPEDRTTVLPNGISLAEFAAPAPADLRSRFGWPGSATVVACVTRLVQGKGLTTLIEAMSLAAGRADLRLALAGDGPLRAELELLATRNGLRERVGFAGEVRDVAGFLAGADAAALLSEEREHCSNSILEALAAARPVIATAAGGNAELVREGENGWLVPPGNPQAVAGVLVRLAADPATARALGKAGRAAVGERYEMTVVAAAHLALWRRLAATRGAATPTAAPRTRPDPAAAPTSRSR